MWWRILTFCLLVTLILFVVLSCIHGRPVIHLFFRRCCDEDIENDQALFENFGNAFLKERLISAIENGNFTLDENEFETQKKLNVHDPESKFYVEMIEVEDKASNDTNEVETNIIEESGEINMDHDSSEVTTEGSDKLNISGSGIDYINKNGGKVKVS